MSFADNFKNWFKTTEAEVLAVIVKVKQGIEFAEHEVLAGFRWLEDHVDDIATAVSAVSGVVGSLAGAGVVIPPTVLKAVADANAAVQGLNAMVASQQKGTPQALIDGYVAAKQAWAAADAATLAVATAPNPHA